MELIIFLAVIAVIWALVANSINKRKIAERRAQLMGKYGDIGIVDRIMGRMMWQGQTEEQLRDSLGAPADVDQRVMKSKVRETWKYHRQGKNRYSLRVTLENGLVVGWDQKG
ncbi:DUF2845 domain-containing protein [Kerstersia gyiorum]|uniref:DUF2845 domain-containing protein n=1 Tax=Kerstersia gyiorum TaxID=206506 RepID=UPI0039E954AE